MKKRIFIALLLVVFSLFSLSLTNVKAKEVGFVNDGNSTIEQTETSVIYTLTGTRSYTKLDVSNMELDKTSLFVSLKYKVVGSYEGFELYANGTSENSKGVDLCGTVKLDSIANKSPWNLTEHTIYDDFIISTVQVDNYTSDLEVLNTIDLRIKGSKGLIFELLDYALTTDGKYNFEAPVIPFGLSDIYTDEEATIVKSENGEQVISYGAKDAESYSSFFIDVKSYDVKYKYFEFTFTPNVNTTVCFRIGDAIDWSLGHKEYAGGQTHTVTLDLQGKYAVTAENVNFSILIYLDGVVAVTEDKVITVHSTTMREGKQVEDLKGPKDVSLYKNAFSEQILAYSTKPSGSFSAPVTGYDESQLYFEITFTPSHDTSIFFVLGNNERWDLGDKVYEGGKTYTEVIDVREDIVTEGDRPESALTESFNVKLYFDRSSKAVFSDDKTVVIHSMKFVDPENRPAPTLRELMLTYYNNGTYQRDTEIFINEASVAELINYFHAQSTLLERTTYFNGDALWMTNEAGTYSYYGTLGNDMTGGRVANVGDTTNSIALAGTTMEKHYTTMFDIKDLAASWTCEDGVFTSEDERVIKAFLDFTAPCFLNSSDAKSANYFTLTKVTVQETENGLLLSLWTDGTNYGAIVNGAEGVDNLLSQALISFSK